MLSCLPRLACWPSGFISCQVLEAHPGQKYAVRGLSDGPWGAYAPKWEVVEGRRTSIPVPHQPCSGQAAKPSDYSSSVFRSIFVEGDSRCGAAPCLSEFAPLIWPTLIV